ncbi:transient receptor potential cation channel subfamily V member 6 [Cimex lectularius]|uniref:Ion transport domain-containing protein n=1 Tax=Cimex lectularius TaxID=79782 RepID=A0A8I6S0R8_CIMLE|nr:transient receptor potential cation channel subfamily V member 6 [Cimex lectularius]
MGNTESNVTSGVKKQADTSSIKIYKLVDLKGGGLLVELMKRAAQTKQYAELDHAIKTKVEPFLYNKGKGKLIPISQLVLMRNKERPRHKMLPPLKNLENPDDYDIESYPAPEIKDEDKVDMSKYRDVCWDLKERGAVGETILHLCLLNATSIHADLAKRLLRFYPKLINDVYMSDEYYGENVLHIAIVNEDPAMVKFLLDSGVDFHERCIGNFMCPEDQKASRTDSLEHEYVNLSPFTNYEGYVYWGEYPLSFAACLGQEECYRLMLARGANPNNQDTNGNTVLHMLIIYSKLPTFDMAYEVGGDLSIRNIQNLTPLTLAAKLARIELFFHILNIEREIYWQIGSITCAAYPLSQIDTIDIETGNISKNSALNLVVFGEKDEHLELMDGVLIDLLNAKWNAFVKNRFYRQFFLFLFYFLISLVCFTLRPGPLPPKPIEATSRPNTTVDALNTTDLDMYSTLDYTSTPMWDTSLENNDSTDTKLTEPKIGLIDLESPGPIVNLDETENKQLCLDGLIKSSCKQPSGVMKGKSAKNTDVYFNMSFQLHRGRVEEWWDDWGKCRLLQMTTLEEMVRLAAEFLLEIGALLYIIAALREARFLGWSMFVENLMTAPSRVMFLFSCVLMLCMPFLRFSCNEEVEDIMSVVIMLTTAPYFLFFCRGFKTVGPFVVMIYRMIMGDLLRFATIYLVFVMGFAQAYYIIFLSFDNPNTPEGVDDSVSNPIPNPVEAVMAMFFMSMTSFGDYYPALERTDHEFGAKLCFVIYMAIVAILLVNMLIAMMGNTYQKIAETRNEWQRQWARIVLVVERGVSPSERLTKLMWYSQPMSDGRRALVLRLNQSEEDKEEMKEILEMKRVHNRMVQKRKQRELEKNQRVDLEKEKIEQKLMSSNNLLDLNTPAMEKKRKEIEAFNKSLM